jgi:HSP20 family protein
MTQANQQIAKNEPGQVQQVERTRRRPVFAPAVDIVETSEEVILRADLPGVEEKDVDITLESGVLTLKGRATESVQSELRLVGGEYVTGDFERVFSLSDEIDQENIKATVRQGVLTLRLPKAGPAKARKIQISAE